MSKAGRVLVDLVVVVLLCGCFFMAKEVYTLRQQVAGLQAQYSNHHAFLELQHELNKLIKGELDRHEQAIAVSGTQHGLTPQQELAIRAFEAYYNNRDQKVIVRQW